jgi:hypothetical protein
VAATNAEVPTDTISTRSLHNTAGRIVPPVEMGVYLRLLVRLAQSTASEEAFAEATSFVQAYMSEGKVPFSTTDVVLWSLPGTRRAPSTNSPDLVVQGDSACRKVADDAIKTIKDECAALQKNVDTAAKAPLIPM